MTSGIRIAAVAVLVAAAPARAAAPSLPWEQALERAARTGEFLLVEVGATWCHACNVLEARTMADSTVRRALSDGWIVVDVDVDRRPDLHRLFHARGHDGLPTLHVLAPDGRELLRSGFVDPAALVAMLRTAREHPPSIALLPRDAEGPPAAIAWLVSEPDLATVADRARAQLLSEEDPATGGFGRGAKYIVAPETDLLLALSAAGDERARAALRRFVAAVTASDVHDREEGGFHRYSETSDWAAPHFEKLLMVQAVMMEALAADARANPAARAEDLAIARETWTFLVSALRDPRSGLFFASVDADVLEEASGKIVETGDAYYLGRAGFGGISSGYGGGADHAAFRNRRRSGPAPAVDRVVLADANARLGLALLRCGDVFRDAGFTASGRDLLDRLLADLLEPGGSLLRYRTAAGNAPAGIEDLGEVGLLLLAAGEPQRDRATALGARLLEAYLDDDGRLRARPAARDGLPVADVDDDGARAIVFLCELARTTDDDRFLAAAPPAFEGLRSASPPPSPAAVGLAARALLHAGLPGAR